MTTHLTVKGVVIREVDYGETDRILDLFTENGILTVRARGARKLQSRFAAVTQLFAYGEFCLRQSRDRYDLDSAVSLSLFYGLRQNMEALALASYFTELIRKVATAQPQPQLMRLFLCCLHYCSHQTYPLAQLKAIFELRLTVILGIAPDLLCCISCLRYEPPRPILRLASANFICTDCCLTHHPYDMTVSISVLRAARHVLFSDFEKVFGFRLGEENLNQFGLFTEQYLLLHLDKPSLPALRAYQTLTGTHYDIPSIYQTGNEYFL